MKWKNMTSAERAVAKHAVLTMRSLMQAAADAPTGQAHEETMKVIKRHGISLLTYLVDVAVSSQRGNRKRGMPPCPPRYRPVA